MICRGSALVIFYSHNSDDLEIMHGVKIMCRIAGSIRDHVKPFDQRARHDEERMSSQGGPDERYGDSIAAVLRDALFSSHGLPSNARRTRGTNKSFEALVAIQGLHTYVMHVTGLVDALGPVAQALWDNEGFFEAVQFAKTELGRMQAWAKKQQIGVRSPQTLIVQARFEVEAEK